MGTFLLLAYLPLLSTGSRRQLHVAQNMRFAKDWFICKQFRQCRQSPQELRKVPRKGQNLLLRQGQKQMHWKQVHWKLRYLRFFLTGAFTTRRWRRSCRSHAALKTLQRHADAPPSHAALTPLYTPSTPLPRLHPFHPTTMPQLCLSYAPPTPQLRRSHPALTLPRSPPRPRASHVTMTPHTRAQMPTEGATSSG